MRVGGGVTTLRARSRAALPAVVAGVLIGTVEVMVAASFAALIFAGGLAVHLPAGIGLTLSAALVFLVVLSLLGTLPGTVGSVQDVSAAVLATIAAAIAATLPPAAPETFFTVVLAIALTSGLVGVFFLVLGGLRLGDLVRFVPYPVVGGFLGGTGVLLVHGSLGVLTGSSPTLGTVGDFLHAGVAARWLPGLAFAAVLLVLTRRGGHFLLVPGAFAAAIALFYGVVAATGLGVATVEARGWLLGPFPEGGLWRLWTVEAVGGADWSVVLDQGADVATLIVFCALALLLNATGIELLAGEDADLDRELRAAGVANLLAGLAGGPPGYHALSLTALARQVGAATRTVGLVAGAVCGLALTVGSAALSLFPRPAIGGLLMFVGLAFVADWVYDTRSRLPRSEYVVLLLIVSVIAVWGFLPGVVAGLAAAVVLFIVDYSRVGAVKHALTGASYRSNVDRAHAEREYLRRHGDQLQVLELQGFLFFGTANSLFERVRSRTEDPGLPPLRFLVLDFRRVSGLDSSAAVGFTKIFGLARARQCALVLSNVGEAQRRLLVRSGMSEQQAGVRLVEDVDRAVQWCEDRLLADRLGADGAGDGAQPAGESAGHWDAATTGLDLAALAPHLERLDVGADHVLIRQGEAGGDLFFLAAGRFTALAGGDGAGSVRLRTMGPGTVVGELGLYLGTPRTATVVTDCPSTVYRLTAAALVELERQRPEVAADLHRWMARLMAQRIADDVRTITALLD